MAYEFNSKGLNPGIVLILVIIWVLLVIAAFI